MDPYRIKFDGLKELLRGESPAVVGERIESALRTHFGVAIDFTSKSAQKGRTR